MGSFIAAAFPLLLDAAVAPGWTTFLLTFGLYLISETLMGQVVEPLIYGHGTGLSPIAVVVSAVFWTWLWGPLGLLLAMPLTVCLVVLGRHVEGLNFCEVLLGNKPALTPQESFYRRALAGDSRQTPIKPPLNCGRLLTHSGPKAGGGWIYRLPGFDLAVRLQAPTMSVRS